MSVNKIKTEPTKTVLVINVGLLIIYLLSSKNWILYTSLGIGLLGIGSNFLAQKIDFLWAKLTQLIGLVMPNILLTIVFYLILTPIAILSRIFGDKNQLSLKNNIDSLFKESNKEFSKGSLENPW